MSTSIQAIRVHEFGGPEVMRLEEIPVPSPAEGQVLIRVRAAGVGPWDAWVRSGRSALPQPLPLTPGSDVAGIVAAVGPGPSSLSPGDEVYGVTNARFTDGYAECAAAAESMLARKPPGLSFVEAASVPVIAVTAWQMLFQHAAVTRGQRVLVHGVAGNVGAYAVQLARGAGVHVVATARPGERKEIQSMGVDEIVELAASPQGHRVDAVIDTVGGDTQTALFPFVRSGGTLVSAVSQPDAALAKEHGVRAVFFLVNVNTDDLGRLGSLLESAQLRVRVGEVLPLAEARRAHEMLDGLRPRPEGKIVLEVMRS